MSPKRAQQFSFFTHLHRIALNRAKVKPFAALASESEFSP
jgi:hypothetical protein